MIYLAGPIDAGNPESERWRSEAARLLRKRGLGSFDPYSAKHVEFMHEDGIYIADQRFYRAYAHVDVCAVEWSLELIAGLFKEIPTIGTWVEIGIALGQHKPVCLYCPDGSEWLSSFMLGLELPTYRKDELDYVVDFMADHCNGRVP